MLAIMSSLRFTRKLSLSATRLRPVLGEAYKSKNLWETRFSCPLLGSDRDLIKTINTKIQTGQDLNNLEVDVFINIAEPRGKDSTQMQEAVRAIKNFRRTLAAHTLLPSTTHAICRLFLESGRLPSLVKLLENRIDYGIFPDPFVLNILFDESLANENFSIASRLAALIMLQEEFGLNQLNDNFALYSVSKYIESRTNFADWIKDKDCHDSILSGEENETSTSTDTNLQNDEDNKQAQQERAEEVEGEEEDEEEEAEYIRVPFLRNPYNDQHFDLTNPRQICGKTLSLFGMHLKEKLEELNLGLRCELLGNILLADWPKAQESLYKCAKAKVATDKTFSDTIQFYLENLHGLEASQDAKVEKSILSTLENLPKGDLSISQGAEMRHAKLVTLEKDDVERFEKDLAKWSELRLATKRAKDDYESRKKLIAEIKAKKEELKLREQYLYFYDNLRKNNLTRIEYK